MLESQKSISAHRQQTGENNRHPASEPKPYPFLPLQNVRYATEDEEWIAAEMQENGETVMFRPDPALLHYAYVLSVANERRLDVRDVIAPYYSSLENVKSALISRLDDAAETERLRHITPGTGMSMVYGEKHAQARAVLALGEMAANALTEANRFEQFPTLSASVGIEAPTLWECADLVVDKYEAWADRSFGIERSRLAGKKAIAEARTAAEAKSAYEAVTWPK